MGGYDVNLDFYFRMYSDGTKKVCVATEGESNTSCSGTSSGSMSFSHVLQNSHKYNFAITEIQKSKIFVQSSPAQRENNKFTCPESIYIYQTSVFVGSGETNSYYNLTMNEEETSGYNTGSLVVDSGQWEPNIQEPGNPVYGCEVIPDEIREWIQDALNLVKYVALVLVIVLGVLDFIQAAASGEADKVKKAGNSFLKRIIAVVVLFLLPVIVELVLNLVEIYGADSTCLPD